MIPVSDEFIAPARVSASQNVNNSNYFLIRLVNNLKNLSFCPPFLLAFNIISLFFYAKTGPWGAPVTILSSLSLKRK